MAAIAGAQQQMELQTVVPMELSMSIEDALEKIKLEEKLGTSHKEAEMIGKAMDILETSQEPAAVAIRFNRKMKVAVLGVACLCLILVATGVTLLVLTAEGARAEGAGSEPPQGEVQVQVFRSRTANVIDDADAASSGAQPWTQAVPGEEPYFRNWFGTVNSKAFHHDGGVADAADRVLVAAIYTPQIEVAGCYEVHEWHPSGPWDQMSRSASLTVAHSSGEDVVIIDQSANGGQWNAVAAFHFKAGSGSATFSNDGSECSGQGLCFTAFDALRFVYIADSCPRDAASGIAGNFVYGSLILEVEDAQALLADHTTELALRRALAELAQVSRSSVATSLSAATAAGRRLSAALRVSFRISTEQPQSLAQALQETEALTQAEAMAESFLQAGATQQVSVTSVTVGVTPDALITAAGFELQEATEAPVEAEKTETAARQQPEEVVVHSREAENTNAEIVQCMPATIVNDFDTDKVQATVDPSALDNLDQMLEAFRPGRVGQKPYFHGWFGDLFTKDFHHDAAINKGLIQVTYTAELPAEGCYLLEEWHTGGSRYCLSYMSRQVPYEVHDMTGLRTAYADQSTNGGQWNALGLFQFNTTAIVIVSNENTDNCEYQGYCYTVFDSLRFVYNGETCEAQSGVEVMRRLSDLACDDVQNLAHLQQVPSQDGDAEDPEASPVKLLHITAPAAGQEAIAGGSLNVAWNTEGVSNDAKVKISLYHDDLMMDVWTYTMEGSQADMELQLPGSEHLSTYGKAYEVGSTKFRVRVDVEHEQVDFSDGWSDQLYAFSGEFVVNM